MEVIITNYKDNNKKVEIQLNNDVMTTHTHTMLVKSLTYVQMMTADLEQGLSSLDILSHLPWCCTVDGSWKVLHVDEGVQACLCTCRLLAIKLFNTIQTANDSNCSILLPTRLSLYVSEMGWKFIYMYTHKHDLIHVCVCVCVCVRVCVCTCKFNVWVWT